MTNAPIKLVHLMIIYGASWTTSNYTTMQYYHDPILRMTPTRKCVLNYAPGFYRVHNEMISGES
jgi:hypothetical protein